MAENKQKGPEQAPEEAKKPVEAKKVEKKTVEVDQEALMNVLERLKTLEAVADKSRLDWYNSNQLKKRPPSRVTLGTYPTADGVKVILAWSNLSINEVYQDATGTWHERQVMELMLEGNKEPIQVNYIDFIRRKKSVWAEVLSRSIDEETGNTTFKVELVDGKRKLEVDSTFVNI